MKIFRTLTVMTLALLMLAMNLKADNNTPNAPGDFSATGTQIAGTTLFNVTLMWQGSTTDNQDKKALGYHVYKANKATEDLSQFEMIATVTTPLQGNTYRYIVERLAPGTYTFFIRAFNNNGESDRTTIRTVTLVVNNGGGGDSFHFTTNPVTTVALGGNYRYEARAVHSNSEKNSHIRYKLISGPDGMTIDSITGNISWTAPSTAKTVTVKILAYLDNDDSQKTDQSWTIRVGGDNNGGGGTTDRGCAQLHGSVHDTSGNIMNGTVTAYMINSNGQLQNGMFTAKLVNGQFTISVPAGTYVLRTQGEAYQNEWFEHQREPANAQQFTIACGDTVEVNFNVTPLPQEHKFVVSGRLTDASTGQGIAGVVYFYRMVNGMPAGDPIVARTNGDGAYEIQLSDRYSYIAQGLANSHDFLPIYFDNVATPTQATVLTLTGNLTNINFALPHKQSYNNSLSGQMVDSAGTGVPGRVTAYLIVSRGNESALERIRTVETDASGNYTISNLIPGSYVILGIPNARPFVPGYFKENDYSVFRWANASQVTVTETSSTGSLIIKLHVGEGRRGIIRIHGHVEHHGGIAKSNGSIQAVAPVSGALVVVVDNNGKAVDFAFSAPDGSYDISNVALGSNTVISDKPGFVASTQTLTFTSANYNVTNDISMDALVSSVAEELTSDAVLSPNPTGDVLNLRFTAPAVLANISVVNSLGAVMTSFEQQLVAGENILSLNASAYPVGGYVLRINSAQASSSIKFVVSR